MKRSSLIVVENATHYRAIVEHHSARAIDLEGVRHCDHARGSFRIIFHRTFRRLGTLSLEHGLFDFRIRSAEPSLPGVVAWLPARS